MDVGPAQLIAGMVNRRRIRDAGNTRRASVMRQGRWCIAAASLVAGLLLPACGSSTSAGTNAAATSPAPSATSAVCQAAADLRASVDQLAHVKIGEGAVDELKSDLADVEAKLSALTAELHDANKDQTNAVTSALDTLKNAVSDLGAHPSTSTVHGVATAIGGLTTAVGDLLTSMAPKCGSASASPSA